MQTWRKIYLHSVKLTSKYSKKKKKNIKVLWESENQLFSAVLELNKMDCCKLYILLQSPGPKFYPMRNIIAKRTNNFCFKSSTFWIDLAIFRTYYDIKCYWLRIKTESNRTFTPCRA